MIFNTSCTSDTSLFKNTKHQSLNTKSKKLRKNPRAAKTRDTGGRKP